MFRIEALNSEIEAKELSLSDHLFHEALRLQPESKTRFHVKNDKGEDFDIVYWDNEDDIEPTEGYPKYVKPPFIARYPFYDEEPCQPTASLLRKRRFYTVFAGLVTIKPLENPDRFQFARIKT